MERNRLLIADAVAAALDAASEESDVVKAAVASAAARGAASAMSPRPVGATVSTIWIVLVSSLCATVITSAALAGAFMLGRHTGPPDALVTVFAATLTGLIGLFVQGPSTRR